MDCTKYRKMISLYVDNELNDYEVSDLITHIKKCDNCKTYYENILSLKDNIKISFTTNPVDYDKSAEIMSKISRSAGKGLNKKKKNYFVWISVAAALFIFVVSFYLYNNLNKEKIAEQYKLEKYVAEHLEKNRVIDLDSHISKVNYEK
ncbi:zf-HC2 domain-containing protein [Deferribacter autotrophicus]|uniref:Zf-HC2 domain-containing protein n=1 Tax=Deferribacter autotrophicus TaxID=500465 RepID=A0A5A8F8Y8_9BACT|nr:zf-HC2 domain-containing protein [Deferribacter autotrophicus]KAA0259227.1 zf-HC2 domain-containing protein [Deferribacter autotrophicus]